MVAASGAGQRVAVYQGELPWMEDGVGKSVSLMKRWTPNAVVLVLFYSLSDFGL